MALFEAVKYDQGFQMNISKLFDMNFYPKPMVFANNKIKLDQLKSLKSSSLQNINNNNQNNLKLLTDDNGLSSNLRIKEMEFCNKIDLKFSFSTR